MRCIVRIKGRDEPEFVVHTRAVPRQGDGLIVWSRPEGKRDFTVRVVFWPARDHANDVEDPILVVEGNPW